MMMMMIIIIIIIIIIIKHVFELKLCIYSLPQISLSVTDGSEK